MKKLVIIGAGQYGQNVRDIVISNGNYDEVFFADDNADLADCTISEALQLSDVEYVIAIGNAEVREITYKKIKQDGKKIATIVHKSAYVASSATIGEGCIVEPNVTILANVNIGECTLLSAGVVVNHNAIIGCYSHVDVGAVISARSEIKAKEKVEAGKVYV